MSSTSAGPGAVRTKIGRRSIHDVEGAVVGYELLFRPGSGMADAEPAVRDRSTSEVISTAFGEFGLHRVGARRNLYLNMTRSLITGELPMPFGPQNVVLEVVEDLDVDAELIAGLTDLKQRGYRLAIDGQVGGAEHAQLLALVDVIKLDVGTAGADLPALVEYVRETVRQAKLMAAGIDDEGHLAAAVDAGFDLYQGDHYQHRMTTRTAVVSPSQSISLQLLSALSSVDTTVVEVERIVSADPGLSLRVLSTVNSASGTGRQISSLPQAIVLLGRRQLSAWVMLAVLGGSPDGRRQDLIDILTRARTCELLAPESSDTDLATAYAVGLLAGVVEVLGADPEKMARSMRLNAAMTLALVSGTGKMGAVLTAIERFEHTGETTSAIDSGRLASAHLHALGTAIETIDTILGAPE